MFRRVPGSLPDLVAQAVATRARRLWVHCAADLSGYGFVAREGYRRFTADACPVGDPLPVLDAATIAELRPRAFRGQWGHKRVDKDLAATIAAGGETVFVGLREDGRLAGLCEIEPAAPLP